MSGKMLRPTMAANWAGQMGAYTLYGFMANCRMMTLFGHVVELCIHLYEITGKS